MVKTYKLHSKFLHIWRDYDRKDLYNVCRSLVLLMKVKFEKMGYVEWVQRHWGEVCNFIFQWEGKN